MSALVLERSPVTLCPGRVKRAKRLVSLHQIARAGPPVAARADRGPLHQRDALGNRAVDTRRRPVSTRFDPEREILEQTTASFATETR